MQEVGLDFVGGGFPSESASFKPGSALTSSVTKPLRVKLASTPSIPTSPTSPRSPETSRKDRHLTSPATSPVRRKQTTPFTPGFMGPSMVRLEDLTPPPSFNSYEHYTTTPSSTSLGEVHSVPKLVPQGGESTTPSAPVDPRDHSTLEFIYSAMHEARFINMNPLSIIQNYLLLHLPSIRSHPPLIFLAPGRRSLGNNIRRKAPEEPDPDYASIPDDGIVNQDHLKEMVKKLFVAKMTPQQHGGGIGLSLESARGSASSLYRGASSSRPSLDQVVHSSASSTPLSQSFSNDFTPPEPAQITIPSTFPANAHESYRRIESYLAVDMTRAVVRSADQTANELPNKNFRFEVKDFGMHLSQSLAGVLGCVESMWEYLVSQDAEADRNMFDELVRRYAVYVFSILPFECSANYFGWAIEICGTVLVSRFSIAIQRSCLSYSLLKVWRKPWKQISNGVATDLQNPSK